MVARKQSGVNYYDVAAVEFAQGATKVYAFAMAGRDITQIADITRLGRTGKHLVGFQRREIQTHVKEIVDYLNQGPNLFPNAIILAVSPGVRFVKVRGKANDRSGGKPKPGYLQIPVYTDGPKSAWIVDGQQRSLALSKAAAKNALMVPVVAFVADSVDTQRQQFILVNRAKPLPGQLINELLPETDDVLLPRDLAARKVPSELCALLHTKSNSPFHRRVSRKSENTVRKDAINDTAIISMIRDRINHPTGALAHLKGYKPGSSDLTGMYRVLEAYWSAVAEVFPQAWELPPEKSRLTHSAGIRAMGSLMDRIAGRLDLSRKDLLDLFKKELKPLAKSCCWTSGTWPYIDREWDSIEQTTRGVNDLTRALNSLYMNSVRA